MPVRSDAGVRLVQAEVREEPRVIYGIYGITEWLSSSDTLLNPIFRCSTQYYLSTFHKSGFITKILG